MVVTLGRINERDAYNNGLFLRNLVGEEWPRDNLAQIYSSGNTGDRGFFGRYYQLGNHDRVFGSLFYRLKPINSDDLLVGDSGGADDRPRGWIQIFAEHTKSLLVDTGLYELIFRPRLSAEMMSFVDEFQPEIILGQGYNLTFAWLPLMLKRKTGAKLAVLTTDDWPKYLYSGLLGENDSFKWLVRPSVVRAARNMFCLADIPLAFGFPMAHEYELRYGRKFTVINHSDDIARFDMAFPRQLVQPGQRAIVAVGAFNEFRYPALIDLDSACAKLIRVGVDVRVKVFSSFMADAAKQAIAGASFIDVYPDPGNEALPSCLKGADILFLAEGFEDDFVSAVELSVSTKAHLFMFSRKPIIVYAAEGTGVAKYAQQHGWAKVISRRSVDDLVELVMGILNDPEFSRSMVSQANLIAENFHARTTNRQVFLNAISQ